MSLRSRVMDAVAEAVSEVRTESGLPAEPVPEVLVVDRRSWIAGNVRTLGEMFGPIDLGPVESKLVAWEGGAVLGLLSRAVLAQYDPYRDVLLVVYPNLGSVAEGQGLRWLVFHEMTHVAQFRRAPWMADHIVQMGRSVLSMDREWIRDAAVRLRQSLPDLLSWARDAMRGEAESTPLLDLMPPQQKEVVLRLHGLVSLLEGHATYITDLISERLIPDYAAMQARIKAERRRPPILKLIEAIGGIEMKRRQYVIGRSFCEAVWEAGGAEALSPAWRSAETMPSIDEIRDPSSWLQRVA